MRFINKKIEDFTKKVSEEQEVKAIETAKEENYKFDESIRGYRFEGQKTLMEFYSGKSYDELYNGSSIVYLWNWHKADKANEYLRNQLTLNASELVIQEMEKVGKAEYEHLPEEEREQAWYQDWYGSKQFTKFLNTGFSYTINEYYKKRTDYEGETTLIEIPDLKEVFSKTDRIFVCEELKVIILIQMVPIYGTKDIDTTLNADYKLSPYFDEKYMKEDLEGKERYLRSINRRMKINIDENLSEIKVLKHISKQKNDNKIGYRSAWNLRGREYSDNRYGMTKTLNEIESEELKKILKTYVIIPGEYMYKPFINENDLSVKKYNVSAAGAHCAYKHSHVMGSTREELQKRLDKAGYVTDYYNIDRSNTYDFSIDEDTDDKKGK